MRFGIRAMQTSLLAPSGVPAQALRSGIGSFNHAALVQKLCSYGFDLIELGGDMVLFFPAAFSPPAIEGLAACKEKGGLTYTVHLPLWSVEPSTLLAPVRRASVQVLVEAIRATSALEPEVYVLHATGGLAAEFYRMDLPDPAKSALLRQFQSNARASLKAILEETGIPSRRLAVETVEFPLDLTLELAEELDLSLCFDTGHVLVGFSGPVELFVALEQCLPRLSEVHLHDARRRAGGEVGYGEDHRPLGAGDLDVGRLLDRLGQVGFAGPVVLELSVEEALESLRFIRSLRL